jgi:hypothetical protein
VISCSQAFAFSHSNLYRYALAHTVGGGMVGAHGNHHHHNMSALVGQLGASAAAAMAHHHGGGLYTLLNPVDP